MTIRYTLICGQHYSFEATADQILKCFQTNQIDYQSCLILLSHFMHQHNAFITKFFYRVTMFNRYIIMSSWSGRNEKNSYTLDIANYKSIMEGVNI